MGQNPRKRSVDEREQDRCVNHWQARVKLGESHQRPASQTDAKLRQGLAGMLDGLSCVCLSLARTAVAVRVQPPEVPGSGEHAYLTLA